ncbi:MAG: hypothetical protein QF554_08225 [Dehalococcoidia bacterium]|jgi:hypothetical protein|nr:hypothetical protein [Dehalococcoidia bacterium]
MRFAWQEKQSNDRLGSERVAGNAFKSIFVIYNIVWWIPIVFAFTPAMSYQAGFVSFLALTVLRLVANLYRNNVLGGERAINFPLRSP